MDRTEKARDKPGPPPASNKRELETPPLVRKHISRLHRDAEFERRWQREYPEDFADPWPLAVGVAQVDKALKAASDPDIDRELREDIAKAARRGRATEASAG
jgi:hypothetical protein